jgi:hypothetical protein
MYKPELLYCYWMIAGGLLGVGFLGILMGAGVVFLFVGLGMCLVGACCFRAPRF